MDPFPIRAMPKLVSKMVSILTKPVSKEEVTQVLHGMHPYKSLGPYVFQGIFFKQYWHIVGDDIYDLVKQAFCTWHFDSALAKTLIILIPKVDNPNSFKEFRPISLCNMVYKLITKVTVNRLRPMLDSIVSPYQNSFLPGRGTKDNAITTRKLGVTDDQKSSVMPKNRR